MEHNHFHLAIKAVIVHNNELLLLQRVKATEGGSKYWELPGGGLSFGEMPERALQREILEEVNLTVDVIKPIWVWSFMKTTYKQVIGITYLCRASNRNVVLSDEHEGFSWVSPENLENVTILPELKADMRKWNWSEIL